MASSGAFSSTGLNEMRAAAEALPGNVTEALRNVARATAVRVANNARRLIAVDTGQTRDTISVIPDVPNKQYLVTVGRVSGIAWHTRRQTGRSHTQRITQSNIPIWLEYGTVKQRDRKFMRPAALLEQTQYQLDMQTAAAATARDTFR